MVGKHLNVDSFAGLGGKQVAVPIGILCNIVLQMALKNVNLVPVIKKLGEPLAPNEVNLQVMPPPDMPPALAQKN